MLDDKFGFVLSIDTKSSLGSKEIKILEIEEMQPNALKFLWSSESFNACDINWSRNQMQQKCTLTLC